VCHQQQRFLHARGVAPVPARAVRVAEGGQHARARGIAAAGALECLDRGGDVAAPALRLGEKEEELRIGAAPIEPFLEHRAGAGKVALFDVGPREHQKRREIVGPVAQRLGERGAGLVELAEPTRTRGLAPCAPVAAAADVRHARRAIP